MPVDYEFITIDIKQDNLMLEELIEPWKEKGYVIHTFQILNNVDPPQIAILFEKWIEAEDHKPEPMRIK